MKIAYTHAIQQICFLVGIGLVVKGVGDIYPPAALIVAGSLMCVVIIGMKKLEGKK